MQNNEIKITYSCEETLKKMKEYMADAKSVTLYTSSLNSLTSYSNGIANEIISNLIFSKKRDKKDVSIVSDFYIDKESFTDSKLNRIREFEYRDIPVKIVHKKSAVDKFFANLKEKISPIKSKARYEAELEAAQDEHERNLLKNMGETKTEAISFYDMFEVIVSNYDDAKDIVKECLNTLKNDLLSDASSLISSEGLDGAKFEKSIEECFRELDKNLNELNKESGEFLLKQIFLFILSIVDLSDPKAALKKANGCFLFYELSKLTYKMVEHQSNRSLYGVTLPILSFFTSRFASIINTLNINSSCNVLVFKQDKSSNSGFFIDFTHLNLDYIYFRDDNNLNEVNCNADEGYSVFGHLDDLSVFDHTKDVCSYDIVNKNLGFGSSDDTLFKRLKDQIKGLNANLNFICASNFNSIKLANLIANKSNKNGTSANDEMNSKDFSNLNKNYVVLSNSPFRSSAGLREEVISKCLDQVIEDELNRPNKSNLVKQKFTDIKTLEPVKDYSKYSIDINKDNQKSTLVLNLSPFARIDKKYIDNIEQKREEFKEIAYQDDTNYLDNYTKYEELFKTNFSHVNAYAKQPNDMEKIKKSEEEYMKKVTLSFKAVFDKVNENTLNRREAEAYNNSNISSQLIDDIKNGSSTADEYQSQMQRIIQTLPKRYSFIEALSLSVAYFIMTKSYSKKMIKKSIQDGDEYIVIEDDEIKALHSNSIIRIFDRDLKLFFYKDSVKNSGLKSGEYLCIEEMSKYMDGVNNKDIVSVEELLAENEVGKNADIKDPLQKDLMKLLIEQADKIDDNYKKDEATIKEAIAAKNKNTLKEAINLKDIAYSNDRDINKEVTSLLVKTTIEEVFPLSKFVGEDGISKIYESLGSYIFNKDAKALRETFLDELGVLNLVKSLLGARKTKEIDRYVLLITSLRTTSVVLQHSKLNLIIQASNAFRLHMAMEYYKLSITYTEITTYTFMRYTHRFSYTDFQEIKRLIKDYAGSLGKSIGASMVSGALELWKTSYEKLEENYKEIMHTRYTYKFNEAYALNNISYKPMSIKEAYDKNSTNTYCYYPVMIYQNYISLNLNRLFLGANISSGGLDYNSFMYYDIDHKKNKLSFNLASKLALNNLSTYLCLDELRGAGNEIDANYFKYARSRYTESDVEIRKLNLDVKEEKEIYNNYKDGALPNKAAGKPKYPIDAYQEAANIIYMLRLGIFNTNYGNTHRNLSRDLVEALDIIGNNNIKGIYVGCKEFGSSDRKDKSTQTTSSIPPRLVGRLATTIVMEDGLYIG